MILVEFRTMQESRKEKRALTGHSDKIIGKLSLCFLLGFFSPLKILDWPKSSLGAFHLMLWKNSDECFSQPNSYLCFLILCGLCVSHAAF